MYVVCVDYLSMYACHDFEKCFITKPVVCSVCSSPPRSNVFSGHQCFGQKYLLLEFLLGDNVFLNGGMCKPYIIVRISA